MNNKPNELTTWLAKMAEGLEWLRQNHPQQFLALIAEWSNKPVAVLRPKADPSQTFYGMMQSGLVDGAKGGHLPQSNALPAPNYSVDNLQEPPLGVAVDWMPDDTWAEPSAGALLVDQQRQEGQGDED